MMVMKILDDLGAMKKIDQSNSLGSITAFPQQLRQNWDQISKLKTPSECEGAKNIVVAGMGGSAIGGRIARSLGEKELKIPFYVNTEYQLPEFVDETSLVVVASYSGNTEETLSCLADAKKKKAKIWAMATGGKLAEEIKGGKIPGFIFAPKDNYTGYPKTAIGYSLGGILGILSRLGYLHLKNDSFNHALVELEKASQDFLPEASLDENPAKKIASTLVGRIGIFISSEHLQGAAYAIKNQINENAHSQALFFDLPEMDHHLIEAFSNLKKAKKDLFYHFINSDLFYSRVKIRYPITQKLLKKQGFFVAEYNLKSKNKLGQIFETVQLGGLVSFYLSILNNEDPGWEPWIPFLKKELAKK
ncbi:MAG TPA: SIS domain-containing protein [Candidatus Bathyarchaeia archaeon]|nr:SIS domain-containing protein [Candidatus Bathyarchaeia archaeon]